MNMDMLTATTQAEKNPDPTAKVGVLLYDTTVEVDDILVAAVDLMRAKGVVVAGLSKFRTPAAERQASMWVKDIMTGVTVRLDQPRGPGAVACMLDPDALAQAACMLQQHAVTSGAELIIVSRFGNAEADGSGMRAEIADSICSGAAVLVPARFSLLHDLEGFLGSPARLLLPSAVAIADWAENVALGLNAATERA